MPSPAQSPPRIRFRGFELEVASGELYKAGRKVALPPKAFEVLNALLERPGEVVTRKELQARLWPAETFVEFDDSLNHAVKKLRQVLGDSAEDPEFVETLPRYGYRLLISGVRATEQGTRIRSLAVLPLANLSEDPRQDYFADGMTDTLITEVSAIREVKVISRTSVMQYKGAKKMLPQIARELKVDALIEGTVQRSTEEVRVTVQLIHAATDAHLWAESFVRNPRDVFTLQAEVARAIAREIKAALTPEDSSRLGSTPVTSVAAYEAYLKGQSHWYKLSPGHLDRALSYFHFALEIDPNYAPAHVGIANVWLMRADTGLMPPGEAFPNARSAVLKALELDQGLAEGHVALANIIALWDRDWSAAEREFRCAIELNPNSADGHFMYADFLISMKRTQEWAVEMQRVFDLDPINPLFQCIYGWHLVYLDHCNDAALQIREALAADLALSAAHMGLWGALYRMGMQEEALLEARRFFAAVGDHEVEDALRRGYAEWEYARAMHLGAEVLAARSGRCHVPSVRVARLYAHAGNSDRAIEWLEKAFEQRESPLIHLGVAWDWVALHDDPRFRELLRRLGLPE